MAWHLVGAPEGSRDSRVATIAQGNGWEVGTAVSPYLWFHFLQFQLPMVNSGAKMVNGIFQK